jgi:hypothetical protein
MWWHLLHSTRIFITQYSYSLCTGMATNMKPCFISHYRRCVDPWFHRAHLAAVSCKKELLLYNLTVSAHVQLLFYTGEIWLILWQILAKHQFPALSILTIFDDWCPNIRNLFFSQHNPLWLLLYVTHWTCGPPLFHKHGCTRLWGNWRVGIFITKLTDTFSVIFPCRSLKNRHTLFNSALHFSINVDRLSTPLTKKNAIFWDVTP